MTTTYSTDNAGSTMEMGTSDQILVAAKRKKKITFIIGAAAMAVTIAVVITLVVLLSGNEGGNADAIVTPSTEGPTTPDIDVTTPTTTSTTTSTTTTTTTESPTSPTESPTDEPTETPTVTTEGTTELTTEVTTEEPLEPPPAPIELEDIISGAYTPGSFNGTWSSGTEFVFRSFNGDLISYDLATDSTMTLIANTSEILQQSSRVSQLSPDGSSVVLAFNVIPVYRYSFLARYSAIDIATTEVTDIVPPGITANEAFLQNFVWGPTGTSSAFVYFNNVYYKPNLTAEPEQITTTGVLNVIYNGIPDWVYEEEVFTSNNAMWFSPDGSRLAYATFDDTNVRIMRVPHYGVPGSVDYQYTQHHEIRYPKPGTTNPTVSVTLRNLGNGTQTEYFAPASLEQPILKNVGFVSNTEVALMWSNRVQNQFIIELCTEDDACTEIFTYTEGNGWIENIPMIFNDAGNAMLTILPQTVDGVLYKQIVQLSNVNANMWTAQGRSNTPHTVSEILLWTSDDIIWYKATGVNDSAEQHIYSIQNSQVSCFTCGLVGTNGAECLYNDASLSLSGEVVSVNCAGPGVPQTTIYYTNGTLIRVWSTNEDISALLTDRSIPEILRYSVPIAAGYPDADVLIQVPPNYENRTNVPLLVYVYGGPDTALVTKQWSIDWGTSLVNRKNIAVAHIDGRGSGLRGVTNMFALNRALGSVEVEDQIDVTRYLQQNLPWLDSNRTCIWGWSYGGYVSSLALARGGDVFRCAIAVAPVTDWRFYDSIYTERYMDIPQNNTEAYSQSSLMSEEVVTAFRNKSYFLVHGTADDNVHYQHAMLISRLLQRRDVFFHQMSYTDEDHALVGVRPHLYHALERFLDENML